MATKRPNKRAAQAKRIEKQLAKTIGVFSGRVQFAALQALQVATPVATGWARSGWQVSVGSPKGSNAARPAREQTVRNRARARLAAHTARSSEIARTYQPKKGRIYLLNRVPYIGRLNQGHSAQAPARFVEKAIDAAIKSTLRTLGRTPRGGRRL